MTPRRERTTSELHAGACPVRLTLHEEGTENRTPLNEIDRQPDGTRAVAEASATDRGE
jgi:hypothetical protein